jgi:hypothetical protein
LESQADQDAAPWDVQLGRRLFAAYISHKLGLSSVDYTLKRYVSDRPGDYWTALAREVVGAMHTSGEGPEAKKAKAEKLAKEANERIEKLMDEYFLFLEEYRANRERRAAEEQAGKHPEQEPFERLKIFDLWIVQKIAGLQLAVERIPLPQSTNPG